MVASAAQKAFCVLEFAKTNSVITVQRAFRRRYADVKETPSSKNIRRWFQQFQDKGCLCKGKSTGRPPRGRPARGAHADSDSEEHMEEEEEEMDSGDEESPNPSSPESLPPINTPYKVRLLKALTKDNKMRRVEFCDSMTRLMDEHHPLISCFIFSADAAFHLSGAVTRHHARFWGTEAPEETVGPNSYSPTKVLNVFCAVAKDKVYGPFFFEGKAVTRQAYLDMLQYWLLDSQLANAGDYILQLDAGPHWHRTVRALLNEKLPQRWIGEKGPQDSALRAWPVKSPDLSLCDFFLWGYVKDRVYVPPLPVKLKELKERITAAIESVDGRTLVYAYDEFHDRLQMVSYAKGNPVGH